MINRDKKNGSTPKQGMNQFKAKVANVSNSEVAKYEIAKEHGITLNKGYNGHMKAKDAGKIGGTIGGTMVKELINMAKNELNK